MSVTRAGGITQQPNRVHTQEQPGADPRIAFFNHHAPAWDNELAEVTRTLKRLEELRERVGLVPGQSVLQIGCGTGRITG